MAAAGLQLLLGSSCDWILGLDGEPPERAINSLEPDGGSGGESGDPDHHDPASAGAPGGSGCDPAQTSCSGAPSGSAEPPDAAVRESCQSYCDDVARVCSGPSSVYASPAQCARFCAEFDAPQLECRRSSLEPVLRLTEAELSDTNAQPACRVAGPGGFSSDAQDSCGSLCDAYCSLMARVCPATRLSELEPADAGFDASECRSACAAVPQGEGYSFDPSRAPAGNQLDCRFFHIGLALNNRENPAELFRHCEHAAGRAPQGETVPCQDR